MVASSLEELFILIIYIIYIYIYIYCLNDILNDDDDDGDGDDKITNNFIRSYEERREAINQ